MPDFESNWKNAMGGHLDYHDSADPAGEEGNEGGGKEGAAPVTAPKNYKPSSPDDRRKWNQFLDYLDKKGVGGSKDLDEKDQSLGKKYLDQYNKDNPKDAVPEDFIPKAQYENYLIRKKGSFPGLSDEQSKYAFGNLASAYKNKAISAVDSWLGSVTSKQYYPTYVRGGAGGQQNFGTSFEDYLKGIKPTSSSTADIK
jgi:hypothetical protein